MLRPLLKKAFYLAYVYSGYVPVRDAILAALGRSWIVVFTYHSLGTPNAVTKSVADFTREMLYLRRQYQCITLEELVARVQSGAPLRRRSCAVTFDDGYGSNFTHAFPILLTMGMRATFFVATGYVGTDRPFPYELETAGSGSDVATSRNVTWSDLQKMQAAGYEVGSHTVNHINLRSATREIIRTELEQSLTTLNRELGRRPRAFSFPWGRPGFLSPAAADEVKHAGYYAAVTACGGVNTRRTDVFTIRRVDVGNGQLGWLEVRARMAGFDPDHWRRRMKISGTMPGRHPRRTS